ncbi:protein O-mannosyl-transferase family [Flavobacterium ardleyense]|uniref:Protein O-mannosyl-transferase family n=1 Tax=Flavobacterium ardleyense TaxID=2038737 RepID=A0ABW5Z8H9_9FLAO
MTSFNFKKWNTILGWSTFAIALLTYSLTVEPTLSFWDCGEYIATSANLEVGHPPGAPLFQMLGAFFAMFAMSPDKVALMVNYLSVFSSAFTILFMFWSLTLLMKRIINTSEDSSNSNNIMILGSALIASLSFTFTDSFWFNAVEAEVYAMASFLIALLFWLGLRWEQEIDTPRGNRWLLIISLVIGLSFGVHFMALLTFPAIGFLYFFKKYKNITVKSFILANIVIAAILLFIFQLLLPYTLAFFAKTEIFMVNSLGLPFNSGTIFAFVLIIVAFYFGLNYTKKKGHVFYNTLILATLFILIGFSSWLMLPIRANADTPINENKPSDAAEVLAYYNREQYGEQKLFYGSQFSDKYAGLDATTPYLDDKPNYERDYASGKYAIINTYKNTKQNTDDAHKALLPRMWSTDHSVNYMTFGEPLEFRLNPEYSHEDELLGIVTDFRTAYTNGDLDLKDYDKFLKTYGQYLIIEKPSFFTNMKFMVQYQFGYMYTRYLLWNFAGRQNDEQGRYEDLKGNWLSGIDVVDEAFIGSQKELTSDMKNNKGRNVYYFLPFILAVIGIFYHAKKDVKSFYVLLVLFLFTGLILKVYLNERPFEPRERDYALVGSFYVFAMWIAFGVYAIFNWVRNYLAPKVAIPVVLVATLLASPVLLATENWDDHDRSGKYTALAMAKAYLDSCEPNAILFTIGDNDTFPLWYVQEIEAYRTDIRIVNTSLYMTDWYIDQMKMKTHKSDPVPSSFNRDQYKGNNRDYSLYVERTTEPLLLDEMLKFIALEDDRAKITLDSGNKVNYFPSKKVFLPIDKNTIIKNKVVNPKYYDSIVPQIEFTITDKALYKNRLMMLDIVNQNNWKRPIYFSGGSYGEDDYLWMKDYLQLDGMCFKLVPIKTTSKKPNPMEMGYVDADKMYDIVMKWDWGNSDSPKIYHDPETRKNSISYRTNLARLAEALINEGKNDKALKVIDLAMTKMPFEYYGYYSMLEPFVTGYYAVGEKEKARALLAKLIKVQQENMTHYNVWKPSDQNFSYMDIVMDIEQYRSYLVVAKDAEDLEFYNKEKVKFNNYNKMFERFGRKMQ